VQKLMMRGFFNNDADTNTWKSKAPAQDVRLICSLPCPRFRFGLLGSFCVAPLSLLAFGQIDCFWRLRCVACRTWPAAHLSSVEFAFVVWVQTAPSIDNQGTKILVQDRTTGIVSLLPLISIGSGPLPLRLVRHSSPFPCISPVLLPVVARVFVARL
jgi:hypothetical protein